MHRVYLLLRNNKQTGPHSLEELVSLQLKRFDLIWVEGKSTGWAYPSEIEALKPYVERNVTGTADKSYAPSSLFQATDPVLTPVNKNVPAAKVNPSSRSVFVSMPATSVQQQTPQQGVQRDAAFPRVQQSDEPPVSKKEVQQEDATINYARSLSSIEEEYTGWKYRQKTSSRQKFPLKKMGFALAVIIVTGCSYLIVHHFINTPVIRQAVPVAARPIHIEQATEPETNSVEPVPAPTVSSKATVTTEKTAATKVEIQIKAVPSKKDPAVNRSDDEPAAIEQKEVKAEAPAAGEAGNTIKTEKENSTGGKKKSFADKVDDFFSKMKGKKKAEPVTEETTSKTSPAAGSTERKSVPEWIELAQVEVAYYSENNTLLEKKTVSFTNVPPKKWVTLPAPDQRVADHADVNLLSATSKQGYVSH